MLNCVGKGIGLRGLGRVGRGGAAQEWQWVGFVGGWARERLRGSRQRGRWLGRGGWRRRRGLGGGAIRPTKRLSFATMDI